MILGWKVSYPPTLLNGIYKMSTSPASHAPINTNQYPLRADQITFEPHTILSGTASYNAPTH